MRAAVWHGRGDVRVENVSEPPPPALGQLQVEVSWCGICGTDLHEYLAGPLYIPVDHPHPLTRIKAPVLIGHEMSGKVVGVGPDAAGFAVGDRVAACPIIGCGKCRWCLTGSMAQCDQVAFLGTSWSGGALSERFNLYAYQCYHLPDTINDEIGSLVEPFSATVRAVARGRPSKDDFVAIVGAGPIGLMALMAARIQGAANVVAVEVAASRVDAAKRCGATAVINPKIENAEKTALDLTNGAGFDVVIECAGQPDTALLAARLTRTRGTLVIMGVFDKPAPIDLTDVVFREKTVTGSMSGYGLYPETIRMMTSSDFRGDALISDRIGLDELVDKGYGGLLHEKDKHVKIVVNPRE
jgi:(R,R)-butanediol dehydrogenase / meso-butanediol dehydrogenase / diacetyl reductase